MGIPIWRPRRRSAGWKRRRDGAAVPLDMTPAEQRARAIDRTIRALRDELVRSRRTPPDGGTRVDIRRFREILAGADHGALDDDGPGEQEDAMALAPPVDDCAEDEHDEAISHYRQSIMSAYPPRSPFMSLRRQNAVRRIGPVDEPSPRSESERYRHYIYRAHRFEEAADRPTWRPNWRPLPEIGANEPGNDESISEPERPTRRNSSMDRGNPRNVWMAFARRPEYELMLRTMRRNVDLFNDSDSYSSDEERQI